MPSLEAKASVGLSHTGCKMKRNLTLILFPMTFTSCFFSNYESERIKSPSGNFEIKATVNRIGENADNYAKVIIHLYDKNNVELTEINSEAGDFNKWAIGWTESGDTILMQSSDIGNRGWIVTQNNPTEIEMTNRLNKRAEFLKFKKYE
jgi:hypothetical protein